MAERILPNFEEAAARLRTDPQALPAADRRLLATSISDAILCREVTGTEPILQDLVGLLARDPDWAVRIEVARMVHLLDDDACSRYVAIFREDSNRFVRSNAERSLARQRKVRQASGKSKTQSRTYTDQIDQLARQYGQRAAAKVRALADQRYAMLASAVAHDVRSILTTLSANTAALASAVGPSKRMASILEDVRYLERTIEAMEQFTKPLPLQRHAEDLAEMIEQAVDKARQSVAQMGHDPKQVEIEIATPPSVRIRVARRLIILAVANVIKNALEAFAGEDGKLAPGGVEVHAVVEGYETQIVIRDNGPGIEPEVLQELLAFVPGTPNKAKPGSSGWGLCLAHRYVTAHGGTVGIDSEVDRGTTVVITLPMRTHAGEEDQ